jgi:hypothetical protein
MNHLQRPVRHPRFWPVVLAGVLSGAMLTGSPGPAASLEATSAQPGPVAQRTNPGPTGNAIVVDDQVELSGFDLATDSAGTSYLGWISGPEDALRQVHLCVLPAGATSCSGGVLTQPLSDPSSSSGLRVVATGPGQATLIWFHDTTASLNGPRGARISTATYASGVLSTPVDQGDAPSFGSLLEVAVDPGGAIWTVLSKGAANTEIEVRQGLGGPVTPLTAPWAVGHAWLAFAGSTPVLAVDRYGSVAEAVRYATGGATWSTFAKVPKTWNVGGAVGMVRTSHGVRLIASEDNAGYRPVVSRFANGRFGTPTLIGDNNSCPRLSHDLVTDVSGRVADVTDECGKITVANLPQTTRAALVRFPAGATVAGGPPQITTTGRGRGWVAFGVQGSVANKLKVVPIMLPALPTTKAKSAAAGKVTVRGPVSCLPAVQAPVGVGANPAPGWKVKSKSLTLDGRTVSGSSINGAALAAGSSHTLVGTAKFSRPGHSTATVKASLSFKACPNG